MEVDKQNELLQNIAMLSVEGYPVLQIPNIALAADTKELLDIGGKDITFDFFDLMTDETLREFYRRQDQKKAGIPKLSEQMLEAVVKTEHGVGNGTFSAQYVRFYNDILPSVFPHNKRSIDSDANLSKFKDTIKNSRKPFAVLNGHGDSVVTGFDFSKPKEKQIIREWSFGELSTDSEVLVREVLDKIGVNSDGTETYSAILIYACNPDAKELIKTKIKSTPIFFVDRITGPVLGQTFDNPASKSINT